MQARAAFAAWAALSLAGAVLMALPDDDARVVSFSGGHGPAPLDFAGMVLALAGFAAYVAGLVSARRALSRRDLAWAVAVYVPANALVAWSVLTDAGLWWALGIMAAFAAMAWLAWRAVRGTASPVAEAMAGAPDG